MLCAVINYSLCVEKLKLALQKVIKIDQFFRYRRILVQRNQTTTYIIYYVRFYRFVILFARWQQQKLDSLKAASLSYEYEYDTIEEFNVD